jgi:hypothetical protein
MSTIDAVFPLFIDGVEDPRVPIEVGDLDLPKDVKEVILMGSYLPGYLVRTSE